MFNFSKVVKRLTEVSQQLSLRTYELEKALSAAQIDLTQTKKDLNEALDLIGRFMDQTVLVAKDVQQLTKTAPKKRAK